MAGFNGVGASASGLCKMVASFRFGAMLKGFREAESAVTVVASPILVGNLTSGRLELLFESQVSVLQLKKLFSLLIFSGFTARENAIHSAL